MNSETKLTIPHLRVLEVLYQSGGSLTRGRIAKRVEKAETYVGRVVGYSDPEKRAKFRTTPLGKSVGIPLLDRGLVQEIVLDIDGVVEICIEITDAGIRAYREQKETLRTYQAARAAKQEEEGQDDEGDNREEGTSDSYSDERETCPISDGENVEYCE